MAKAKKLTCKCYVPINGVQTLWYEVDEDGNVQWHLPKDIEQVTQMLKNIGEVMSRYAVEHPDCAMLKDEF